MFMCPTSELPICCGGRPTSMPGARMRGRGGSQPQFFPHGFICAVDGVIDGVLRVTPAVQDNEDKWFVLELHLNFIQAIENRIDNEYLGQGDSGAKFNMKQPAAGIECWAG